MTKIILTFLIFVATQSAFAQHILKSIESKKTGESVTAFCEEYEGNICKLIRIKHLNPLKDTETLLFEIDPSKMESDSEVVQNVIHEMESDQMMKDKYKFLGTIRKVCELGWSKKSKHTNFNDNTGCLLKGLFGTAIFVGVGVLVPGAGFALVPAAKALALGGAVGSIASKDLTLVQFFLFYPAIGVDLVRAATVYPVKKIVNTVKNRHLKRKIIPLLEEMSYEVENPASLSDLQNETLYEHDDYRQSIVKHGQFKKILKFFKANGEIK